MNNNSNMPSKRVSLKITLQNLIFNSKRCNGLIYLDDIRRVDKIIANGVNINHIYADGATPIHIAVKNGANLTLYKI